MINSLFRYLLLLFPAFLAASLFIITGTLLDRLFLLVFWLVVILAGWIAIVAIHSKVPSHSALKYLSRYLMFWLPAFLAGLLFSPSGTAGALSLVVRLLFGLIMIAGWCVTTGTHARVSPHRAFALLSLYFGLSLLVVRFHYMGDLRPLFGSHSVTAAGIFSYVPLDAFLQMILDFNIQHEVYIIIGISILNLFAWLMGMLYRWHNPNPYRPRIKS